MTLRLLAAVCMACGREPGVPMCPMCSALEDAERDAASGRLTINGLDVPEYAYRLDVTPPPRKDAAT